MPLSQNWFHYYCVEESNDDIIGIWPSHSCRCLPVMIQLTAMVATLQIIIIIIEFISYYSTYINKRNKNNTEKINKINEKINKKELGNSQTIHNFACIMAAYDIAQH